MVKKIFSIFLSATLVLSLSPLSALADQPTENDDTFHYVALGDSIAAGYGTSEGESLETDPALVLHTEKDGVADEVASAEDGHTLVPVKTAYPYLFYQNTLLQMGAQAGMNVSFANLSSTAFRACDVSKTILTSSNDPYVYASEAASILDNFVSEGASARLSNYHALYKKYLSEADLVSVQLGGNDMIMGALGEMRAADNPVLNSFVLSLELLLFGCSTDEAVLYGISQLAQADITLDDVIEAAEFLSVENLDAVAVSTEKTAVNEVSGVLDAIDEVGKSDVQIALLDMFNPYGNSLEYGSGEYAEVANKLIKSAVAKVTSDSDLSLASYDDTPQAVAEAESDLVVTTDEATSLTNELQCEASSARESLGELKEIATGLDISVDTLLTSSKSADALVAVKSGLDLKTAKKIVKKCKSLKENLAQDLSAIKSEIAYPIQYLLVGRTIDSNIQAINTDLAELANERDNVALVDVYNIPNECNSDPHPDANGHEAIAELMGTQLQGLLDSMMPADPSALPATLSVSASCAPADKGKKATVSATSNAAFATYSFYYSKNGGKTWKQFAENTTGTVSVTANDTNAARQWKVVAATSDGQTAEASFEVVINDPTVTANVKSASKCNGKAKVSVSVDGYGKYAPTKYTYYYSINGGKTWMPAAIHCLCCTDKDSLKVTASRTSAKLLWKVVVTFEDGRTAQAPFTISYGK